MQPIFQLKDVPQRIHAKAATPLDNLFSRHFRMRGHPRRYFIVICARGDKLPQRFRFQASSGKKLAIERAVVLVRGDLAEQFRPAFIDQSSRHRREMLAQRCVRAARCTAFQVGSHGAQFFSVHYAMIVTQEFRLVEDASNPSSFLTRCEGLTIKLADRPFGAWHIIFGGQVVHNYDRSVLVGGSLQRPG